MRRREHYATYVGVAPPSRQSPPQASIGAHSHAKSPQTLRCPSSLGPASRGCLPLELVTPLTICQSLPATEMSPLPRPFGVASPRSHPRQSSHRPALISHRLPATEARASTASFSGVRLLMHPSHRRDLPLTPSPEARESISAPLAIQGISGGCPLPGHVIASGEGSDMPGAAHENGSDLL
jgi:hypothetical protein